jgi:serine/threonine-protein kinase RsbT
VDSERSGTGLRTVDSETRVPIDDELDILTARQNARELATALGFDAVRQTLIATAISELARNILKYAGCGEIVLRSAARNGTSGVTVIATDEGPGIADLALAMTDGFSTDHGLGLGLPGTKRLMDDFDLVSTVGSGTVVTTTMWARPA